MLHALLLSIVIAAESAPVGSDAPAAKELPPCRTAHIAIASPIDSSTATLGQTFTFTVSDADPATGSEPPQLAGATGYGIISAVRKAHTGGIPGAIGLEPRFIVTRDGTHVPIVLADTDSLFEGKSGNVKGALNFIPYVSIGTRSYNALHKGGDVTVPATDKLRIAIGDDVVTGACQVLGEERMQASR
jgi:hypothetical protein